MNPDELELLEAIREFRSQMEAHALLPYGIAFDAHADTRAAADACQRLTIAFGKVLGLTSDVSKYTHKWTEPQSRT